MKNTNRQISPLGRSTKKKAQVYHSCVKPLFEVQGSTFIYYNESPFIARLKRSKFPLSKILFTASGFLVFYRNPFLGLIPFYPKRTERFIRTTHHQLIFDF